MKQDGECNEHNNAPPLMMHELAAQAVGGRPYMYGLLATYMRRLSTHCHHHHHHHPPGAASHPCHPTAWPLQACKAEQIEGINKQQLFRPFFGGKHMPCLSTSDIDIKLS